MSLLILGGTADGRILAEYFHRQGIVVIYSVAGLVRTPDINCEIVSGGFTQFGGLAAFVRDRGVTAILDVTHPYAQRMSSTAVDAGETCGIPCWRFHRVAWEPGPGDRWQAFSGWQALAESLSPYQRVMLTCGQLTRAELDYLGGYQHQRQWLRTAVQPKVILPETVEWIKAIGPFALADEKQFMSDEQIDVLVSKNSGGDSTSAKLQAARELEIPVLMLERPELPNPDVLFTTHEQCQEYVTGNFEYAE